MGTLRTMYREEEGKICKIIFNSYDINEDQISSEVKRSSSTQEGLAGVALCYTQL